MPNFIEIKDFSAPELDLYARLNEVQLLRCFEPGPGVFIAESPYVIERALNAGYVPISFLMEQKQTDGPAGELLSRCETVPVYVGTADLLRQLTGFPMTRGALCAMYRKPLKSVEEVCTGARRIAVLENVVNPTNVGAIFRSAAALNMDAVLLTPQCSDPLYRRSARVSMGTVFQVPWTFLNVEENRAGRPSSSAARYAAPEGLRCLHDLGFRTAAMALSNNSIPIDAPCLQTEEKLAIVLGTEGDGLAPATIADCDYTVRIPMSHGVDSLNVAAASAVAFWQLGRGKLFEGNGGLYKPGLHD